MTPNGTTASYQPTSASTRMDRALTERLERRLCSCASTEYTTAAYFALPPQPSDRTHGIRVGGRRRYVCLPRKLWKGRRRRPEALTTSPSSGPPQPHRAQPGHYLLDEFRCMTVDAVVTRNTLNDTVVRNLRVQSRNFKLYIQVHPICGMNRDAELTTPNIHPACEAPQWPESPARLPSDARVY